MSWYDPTSWDWSTDADRTNNQRGKSLTDFGRQTQEGFGQDTAGLDARRKSLEDIASGRVSIAGEQLRQGMQQGQAAQQSMAASANPMNAAMAARNASMNMSRLGYGLSGQQAVAGMQEREAAQQALANMLLQKRQQDLMGTTTAFGAPAQDSDAMKMTTGAAAGLAAAAAKSDKRAKRDIEDGDDEARKVLEGLRAYTFKYKDPANDGAGRQLGVMAQDLEKVLPQAVLDTSGGKKVDGGKLATALAAMMPGINERLTKLEDADGSDADEPRRGKTAALVVALGNRVATDSRRSGAGR